MKLPWWPFYGSAFFSDEKVRRMSNAQIGMYVKLLDHQWEEGSVPLDVGFFAFMDLRNRAYDPVLAEQEFEQVMQGCFVPHPSIHNRVYNPRMEEVRKEQQALHAERQRAGRLGGKAKARNKTLSTQHDASVATAELQQNSSIQKKIKTQNQKKTQNQSQRQKEIPKSSGTDADLVPAVNGIATWEAYSQAYITRYGVVPVRNQTVNSQLKQVAARLGALEAPLVAAFYLTHNNPYYVQRRHPANLLLQNAEGLRTEWATGVKATTSEAKNAEFKDNVIGQADRVLLNLKKREVGV